MRTETDITNDGGARRKQILLVAGAAVLFVAALYFMFLRGGGDGATDPIVSQPAAEEPVVVAEEDPMEEPAEPERAPVETFEVFASRDPFKPVVGEPQEDAPERGSQQGSDPDDGGNGDPDGSDATEPATENGGAAIGGRSVTLIDVFKEGGKPKAQVQVDSTVYTVTEGEVFAENFQLVSTAGECATMLFGDDQFTLCEGEQILK